MISMIEAKQMCNSIEIKLILDSYPDGLESLNDKKILTRIKNCKNKSKYYELRYNEMNDQFDLLRKEKKMIPLIPEIKMNSFKQKKKLFIETEDRYQKALNKRTKKNS